MRKIWLGAISLVALYGCSSNNLSSVPFFSSLPDGVTLVEEVEAEPGKAMIPYSKYQLDNGLTVILSPDHSDPLVHVDVTYHVGSAREEVGKSGFAHFFEHMPINFWNIGMSSSVRGASTCGKKVISSTSISNVGNAS